MCKLILKFAVSFFVSFFSALHAQSIAPTQNVCFGDIKNYTVDQADGPSGTPGSTYIWRVIETGFVGDIINQGTNAVSINWGATPAGLYKLSVIETNAFCDGPEVIVNVTIKDIPAVIVNDVSICKDFNANMVAIVNPLDSGNDYTYNWTTPSGVNPGNVATITANVAGDYSVTVKDVFGCISATAKGTLTINSSPIAEITPAGATAFCEGTSVILQANTGFGLSYQWEKAGVPITGASNSFYTATQDSSYSVTVTNSNGCIATSLPVSVTVNPLPLAVITIPVGESLEFCSGGSVLLTANTGTDLSYQWKNSDNTIVSTSGSYTATQSSDYTLTVTNSNGCSQTTLPVTVIVHLVPDASIIPAGTVTFCDGDSVVLNAVAFPGASYQWNDSNGSITGANSSSYTVTQSSDYTVTVTDKNFVTNCSATTYPPITVTKTTLPVTGTISYD